MNTLRSIYPGVNHVSDRLSSYCPRINRYGPPFYNNFFPDLSLHLDQDISYFFFERANRPSRSKVIESVFLGVLGNAVMHNGGEEKTAFRDNRWICGLGSRNTRICGFCQTLTGTCLSDDSRETLESIAILLRH